jgi:hypothetical protein
LGYCGSDIKLSFLEVYYQQNGRKKVKNKNSEKKTGSKRNWEFGASFYVLVIRLLLWV